VPLRRAIVATLILGGLRIGELCAALMSISLTVSSA
jgi:hypothetical protein